MAIIYQKDKNAIKFIKDFYKQITNKVPSDPQVDSILANFDGNYDSMIRGMYVNLLGKSPSDNQVNQVVNRYLLKKKIRQMVHQVWQLEDRHYRKQKTV